jgi:hypothetical protein
METAAIQVPAAVKGMISKMDSPVGKVILSKKILAVAEMDVDEIRQKLEDKQFAHAEEVSIFLNAIASPFGEHKTALRFKGVRALMKDPKFIDKLKEKGKNIPDVFVTKALDQIADKLDDMIKIF